jgi:hypothetical protein
MQSGLPRQPIGRILDVNPLVVHRFPGFLDSFY